MASHIEAVVFAPKIYAVVGYGCPQRYGWEDIAGSSFPFLSLRRELFPVLAPSSLLLPLDTDLITCILVMQGDTKFWLTVPINVHSLAIYSIVL